MKKLAVITGAGRGFGRSLVEEFAESGWSVVATSRSIPDLPRDFTSGDVSAMQQTRAGGFGPGADAGRE